MRLVYVGRRVLANGKLGHGFAIIGAEEHPSYFAIKKPSHWIIGGIYEGEAESDETGLIKLTSSTLKCTRDKVAPNWAASWELADREAYRAESTRLAVERARRSPEYKTALAPIVQIMGTAKSYADAYRIAEAIKTELLQGWISR